VSENNLSAGKIKSSSAFGKADSFF